MGLLDQVLGVALSGNPATAPPPQNVLQSVVNLLHSPSIGGVAGLVQLFQSHGLGNIANGWVSNGPNPGIAPSQLTQVLGQDRISQYAQELGLSPDQAAGHLSQILPHVVDQMTPNGQLPQGQTNASSVFEMLKSKLL